MTENLNAKKECGMKKWIWKDAAVFSVFAVAFSLLCSTHAETPHNPKTKSNQLECVNKCKKCMGFSGENHVVQFFFFSMH